MRKRLVAVLATLAAMTAIAAPANAITYNGEKDFVHDYVGLLAFHSTPDPETGDTFVHRCTGTLISPTIVESRFSGGVSAAILRQCSTERSIA